VPAPAQRRSLLGNLAPAGRAALRLRGGVEFEDVTEADADGESVDALQKAVDRLKRDAAFLHAPEMAFFRDYLISMGARLPKSSSNAGGAGAAPTPAAGAAAKAEEADESEELSEEMQDDEDVIAAEDADVQPPQTPPDLDRTPSESDFEKVAELKGQAMEAAAAGDTAKALDLWTQCITLAPSAPLVCGRAMCYIAMKKPLAAIRDAESALQINR
jgi:suppressor of tumorigenicity protein 13